MSTYYERKKDEVKAKNLARYHKNKQKTTKNVVRNGTITTWFNTGERLCASICEELATHWVKSDNDQSAIVFHWQFDNQWTSLPEFFICELTRKTILSVFHTMEGTRLAQVVALRIPPHSALLADVDIVFDDNTVCYAIPLTAKLKISCGDTVAAINTGDVITVDQSEPTDVYNSSDDYQHLLLIYIEKAHLLVEFDGGDQPTTVSNTVQTKTV